MKVIAKHNGKGFTGMMTDEEMYNKVRDGELDWKLHVKEQITHYTVPKAVFERLVEMDREKVLAEHNRRIDMADKILKEVKHKDG